MAERRRSEPRPLWEQEATWCVHFNDVMNKTCHVGIAYADVTAEGSGKGRFPCLKENATDPTRTDLCERAEYLTEEQAKVKAAEREAHLRIFHQKIADGICTACDQKVERQRQVGRCVYAEPCGHRIGQGRAQR